MNPGAFPPALPNIGSGFRGVANLPLGDRDDLASVIPLLIFPPSNIATLQRPQSRTLEENLARFHTLIRAIDPSLTEENLEELSELFETLQKHLENALGKLDENSLDRVLEITSQLEDLKENYLKAVNGMGTEHLLAKIHQDSQVGVRENVANLMEGEIQVPLQRLRISEIRRIAGDGNCFYTSLATLLLEAIAQGKIRIDKRVV